MALANKSEINNFLSRVREVIGKINGFHFVDREKNLIIMNGGFLPGKSILLLEIHCFT